MTPYSYVLVVSLIITAVIVFAIVRGLDRIPLQELPGLLFLFVFFFLFMFLGTWLAATLIRAVYRGIFV